MNREDSAAARTGLIVASLELAAERSDDIVPLVYERLFARRADLRSLFAIDAGSVPRTGMGNMVNEVVRLLLAEDAAALETEAQAAVVFHVGWGLDIDMYGDVLHSLVSAVREVCADGWTPAMAQAWDLRLAEVLEALGRHHESIEGPRVTPGQPEPRLPV